MKEYSDDLWKHHGDVKVITTNGDINARGLAVMGRGVALQSRSHVPGIQQMLADSIRRNGNHVSIIARQRGFGGHLLTVVSFPVKHHWFETADLELIRRSSGELDVLATIEGWKRVVMPRPGCGNGGLLWTQVKPVIDWLDDRFVVVNNGG